jgi:N-methylhydantoinase A
MSVEEFAAGVIRVVNATMEKAVRVVSIERGYDPREFTLVAFGGAGGLHACDLASALGIRRVIVPAMPGALSAFGILVSDVVKDFSRTVVWRTRGSAWEKRAGAAFAELRKRAERDFREERWSGKIVFEETLDVRYCGQGYELNVPFRRDALDRFQAEHKRRYGYAHEKREVELVTLRLRARIPVRTAAWSMERQQAKAQAGRSHVWVDGHRIAVGILDRESIEVGRTHTGPAVVTEYSATTWVSPRAKFYLDQAANLIVEVPGA